jgi:DNA-binding protein HU-beta
MQRVTKSELERRVATRVNTSIEAAGAVVDAVFEEIREAVADGEQVAVPKFGVFERRQRPARTGSNPRTGAAIEIPARGVPAFRPSTVFRGAVADTEPKPE